MHGRCDPGRRTGSVMRPLRAALPSGWMLAPVLVVAVVYYSLINVYFHADDLRSFLVIADRGAAAFLFEQFGGHALVVSRAFWVLWYRLFGLSAAPYMWSVLLTHLLNVVLLYLTLRRLTGRQTLAALGAAWWGASPLHVGALGWYSVYGHVLVGTWMLLVLAHASALATRQEPVTPATAVAWVLLLALAVNSFGTGIGAAAAVPLALLVCLPSAQRASLIVRVLLLGAPLWAVLDYLGMGVISQRVAPSIDSVAFLWASWSIETVGRQAQLLVELFAMGLGGLLSGHLLPRSRPADTLMLSRVMCVIGMAVIGTAALRADSTRRRWIVGQLGVAVAVYSVIAIGRAHLIRAFNFTPEAAALASRYHYAATVPLTVAFVLALAVIVRRQRYLGPAVLLAAIAVQVAAWRHSGFSVPSFDVARAFVTNAQQRIAALAHAAPGAADAVIGNVPAPFSVLGVVRPEQFPGWAGVFVISGLTDEVAGHRVYFAESSRVRNAFVAPDSRRLSHLLVPPPHRLGETCELSAVLQAVRLGKGLLACPLAERAAAACAHTMRRRSMATARSLACRHVDPTPLDERVSTLANVVRTVLSCPAAGIETGDGCQRRVLRRFGVLLSDLGACHRDAIVSHRGVDDPACADRATARYIGQLGNVESRCAACVDVRMLATPARSAVQGLLDAALRRPVPPGAVVYQPVAGRDDVSSSVAPEKMHGVEIAG